jgi:hypothetical protein
MAARSRSICVRDEAPLEAGASAGAEVFAAQPLTQAAF